MIYQWGGADPVLEKEDDLGGSRPAITDLSCLLLYIEDNPANIKLIESMLFNENSIEFAKAMTGKDGLSQAEELHPDVIILDINLPDISGIEVCEQLKENPKTKSIPVIALTADIARRESFLKENENFYDVFYKPVNLPELMKSISQVVSRSQ